MSTLEQTQIAPTRIAQPRIDLDRDELIRFGRILDHRPASLQGETVAMALAAPAARAHSRRRLSPAPSQPRAARL